MIGCRAMNSVLSIASVEVKAAPANGVATGSATVVLCVATIAQ